MRLLLVLLPVLLLQGKTELKPKFQKFDRVALGCKVQTEVKSSNNRDAKYVLELEMNAEVEKAEGETVVFDCGVSMLKVAGTLDGRKVDYEWRKGGSERGDTVRAIQKALTKGWKVTLVGGKGLKVDDFAGELCDTLPLLNPGIFLGFSVPLPQDAVDVGKGWTFPAVSVPYYQGYTLKYASLLNFVDKDTAKISSTLTFSKPEGDAPVDMAPNVKGTGSASMDYDVKSGRPVRGATAVQVQFAQGGLKRDISQVIEFDVRR